MPEWTGFMLTEKQCRRCKEVKSVKEFHKATRRLDGLNDWCKSCRSEHQQKNRPHELQRMRVWRQNNLERHTAGVKKWQAANPERVKVFVKNAMHKRRQQMEATTTVTPEQWLDRLTEFNHACAYCQQPVSVPEMEHMNPLSRGGGHVIENIIPACRACNASKGDKTLLEFLSYQSGISLLPVAA